jgi:hypothetical protein
MIRVELPYHLRNLAGTGKEVTIQLEGPVTQRAILDGLEAAYPVLRGTIRERASEERRPFIRFFAGGRDWSHEPLDAPLPDEIAQGVKPFRVIGAMAGG